MARISLGPERRRDGYDVAYAAVIMIGVFLSCVILALGVDLALNGQTAISDNGQLVIVAGMGTIGSIAGGALGYWAGATTAKSGGLDDEDRPTTSADGPPEDEGA